jgi:hypothetical protein
VRQFDQAMWLEEATAIESDLSSLVAGLTEAQFHAPPRDGGWCVGHCIEHLLLTRPRLPGELGSGTRERPKCAKLLRGATERRLFLVAAHGSSVRRERVQVESEAPARSLPYLADPSSDRSACCQYA